MAREKDWDLSMKTLAAVRSDLERLETALPCCLAALDVTLGRVRREDGGESDTTREFATWAYKHITESNVRCVYEYSQSPIERLLLGSVVFGFAATDPLGAIFLPPTDDAVESVRMSRLDLAMAHSIEEEFRADYKGQRAEYAPSLRSWLDAKDPKNAAWIEMLCVQNNLGLSSAWRLQLQPTFQKINEGKAFRPDLYAWVPRSSSPGVIIECDGYEYHSDRGTFESDRRRDRIFASLGYQVVRYSGTEIHRNPMRAAADLHKTLQRLNPTGKGAPE